jgi:integrase
MSRLADRIRTRQDRELLFSEGSDLPLARRPPPPSPAAVYLASLAEGSQPTQRAALKALAAILGHSDPLSLPWAQLHYTHVAALRARLVDRYAPATANRMLAALRGVFLACRRLGLLTSDQHAQLVDIPRVRGEAPARGRMLPRPELSALMRACAADASPRGRRDAAIIAVGVAGGLRRAELCALDRRDLIDEGDQVRVQVRRGKGAKDRVVYLHDAAAQLVRVWRKVCAHTSARALFVAISRTGRLLDDRRLTPAAVRFVLLRRCAEAGIPTATPHDLRRTYISQLLDRGVDIAMAARLAGHANVATTARYDRRGDEALRAAAEKLGAQW